jgi:hypothetical protein
MGRQRIRLPPIALPKRWLASTLRGESVSADWSHAERANLAEACDSTGWLPLLEMRQLPPNYAAVLARCELARDGLGLPIDAAVLRDLVERVRGLLTRHPLGWHDDSPGGAGRYDIYTADLYLFVQPLVASAILYRYLAMRGRGIDSNCAWSSVSARNGAAFTQSIHRCAGGLLDDRAGALAV